MQMRISKQTNMMYIGHYSLYRRKKAGNEPRTVEKFAQTVTAAYSTKLHLFFLVNIL
jgi:hypothetical protein